MSLRLSTPIIAPSTTPCSIIVSASSTARARTSAEQRLAFWGTLALMRCVGSSPAAAASALRNRLAADPDRLEEQVFDDDGDEADAIDVEPASGLERARPLADLVQQAERLVERRDPKLDALVKVLKPLISRRRQPGRVLPLHRDRRSRRDGLRKAFPKLRIEAVTGALTPDERRARVEDMGEAEQRLLVATDCLSEGINLQILFDTVVHYDLSWNPTRHQQREGRVDRFGQRAPLVRSMLLYSPDSAIDGAVLDVILRKAEAIRKATGVTVPLPDERGAVTGALMNAVLLRKRAVTPPACVSTSASTMTRTDGDPLARCRGRRAPVARAVRAERHQAPRRSRPNGSAGESCWAAAIEVRRFVERAMSRLDAPLGAVRTASLRPHLGASSEAPCPNASRRADLKARSASLSPSQRRRSGARDAQSSACRPLWRRRCSKARWTRVQRRPITRTRRRLADCRRRRHDDRLALCACASS